MIRYSAATLLAAAVPAADGCKAGGNATGSVEEGGFVGRQGPGAAAGVLFSVRPWHDSELEDEWAVPGPRHEGAPAARGFRVAHDGLRPSP